MVRASWRLASWPGSWKLGQAGNKQAGSWKKLSFNELEITGRPAGINTTRAGNSRPGGRAGKLEFSGQLKPRTS